MDDLDETRVGRSFLEALLASPEGRQHMLSVSVDAEEGDESGIFDQLADAVDVPELRRIVETHRDDEARHAGMYRECLRRNGYTKQALPSDVRIVRQAGEITGRREEPIRTPEDIVRTYALLLAIEERGVQQFPILAEAFEPYDPETADTYRRVTRDERGHVRYCRRVGRHFAADDAAWNHACAEAGEIEAEAFRRVGAAQAAYCAQQGWVDLDEVVARAG
jgi:rubrerythrin